jgi:hypothetical protein
MYTECIHHFTLIHPFLVPTNLPLVPTPEKDLFFPLVFHFLIKCILIVQEDVILVLQACIYHALIKLTPSPIPCSFSITMLP